MRHLRLRLRALLLIGALAGSAVACEKKAANDEPAESTGSESEAGNDEGTAANAASEASTAPSAEPAEGAEPAGAAGGDTNPIGDLVAEHSTVGKTAEGALELWMREAANYIDDPERGVAAIAFLTVPFKKDGGDWTAQPSYGTFVRRLNEKPQIFRSYSIGTSPENGYALPDTGFELNVVESVPDEYGRGHKVVVESSGADNPRPIYLRKSSKSGLYFVDTFANAYLDVKPMVDPDAETFE